MDRGTDNNGISLFCYYLPVFVQECQERFNLNENQVVQFFYTFYATYHGPKNERGNFGELEHPYMNHFLFDELDKLNKVDK